jgi:hypothetical protein
MNVSFRSLSLSLFYFVNLNKESNYNRISRFCFYSNLNFESQIVGQSALSLIASKKRQF